MTHTLHDKKKLVNRVRRLRGQLDGIERALEEERECSGILQQIAACRGAMNGLMLVVLEGHVREHVLDPDQTASEEQARATKALVDVLRSYLK